MSRPISLRLVALSYLSSPSCIRLPTRHSSFHFSLSRRLFILPVFTWLNLRLPHSSPPHHAAFSCFLLQLSVCLFWLHPVFSHCVCRQPAVFLSITSPSLCAGRGFQLLHAFCPHHLGVKPDSLLPALSTLTNSHSHSHCFPTHAALVRFPLSHLIRVSYHQPALFRVQSSPSPPLSSSLIVFSPLLPTLSRRKLIAC